MTNLALYYFDSCPFCQMVLRTIDGLSLEVEMRNIQSSQEHLDKLIADTGRKTVPCLYIDGKPKHESAEIVEWLKNNADKLARKA